MRISDWSSDVCSSDLATYRAAWGNRLGRLHARRLPLLSALLSCAPAGPRRWCGNRGMAQRIAAQPLYPRNTRIQGGRGGTRGCLPFSDVRERVRFSGKYDRSYPDRRITRWKRERSTIRRSEEHTSELQSLMRNSSAVFCLKNKK